MTFAEYTKKRKEEKATSDKNGGVQGTATSPPKDEKPKSFAEYTRKKKEEEISNVSFANTKTSSYATERKNAYTKASDGVTKKTTISSNLSDTARRKRLEEINAELRQINSSMTAINRGRAYGNTKTLDDMEAKYSQRLKELNEEKKQLERVGEVTASEQNQWSVDDAKKNVARIQSELDAYGSRPSAAVAEEWKQKSSELYNAKEQLKSLEIKQGLYDDISKFGDVVNKDTFGGQTKANYRNAELSREADKAMNRYLNNPTEENKEIAYAYDALSNRYAENNKNALDDENVKASWISKSAAGYMPQFLDQIVPEAIGGAVGALVGTYVGAPNVGAGIGAGIATSAQMYGIMRGSVYRTLLAEGVDEETALKAANDEALISTLIEGGETAVSWMLAGGGKALSAIGKAATKSVAKGTAGAATKAVANRFLTTTAKKASQSALKKGIKTGAAIIGNGITEYGEEFAQGAVSRANREKALATVEKEIGRYGKGNVDLYNRPILKNADGTISTVDSVTFQFDDKFIVLPTIVRDANGNPVRLENDEDIVAHYVKTGEYLGEFDTQEEADAYAVKLHSAQAYYYSENKSTNPNDGLVKGGAKVIGDAIFGGNIEALGELHEQGKEGFKIGLMFGGTSTIVNSTISRFANAKTIDEQNAELDKVRSDDVALTALIEKGKASGEGTVAKKIATEVETAREKGKVVSRDQVRRLIEANKAYTKTEQTATSQDGNTPTTPTTPIAPAERQTAPATLEEAARGVVEDRNKSTAVTEIETLDALTADNKPIYVDEVMAVTEFGMEGAKVVTEYANTDGKTFSEAVDATRSAYRDGFTNPEAVSDDYTDLWEKSAFNAGRQDRIMQDAAKQRAAKKATIYDGTFTENEHTMKFTKPEKKMISIVAKALRMDIDTIDKIIANEATGARANAQHVNGKMTIASYRDAEAVIYKMLLHEGGHRMSQLAPSEFGVLMDALYARAVQRAKAEKLGVREVDARLDEVKASLDNAGLSQNMRGYVEELAVQELETIFGSAREFNKWYAEISGNTQLRSGFERFVDWVLEVIEDIKRALKNAKLSAEERAEAKRDLAELEHIKDLLANAIKASESAATELANKKAEGAVAENATSEDNGTNYSLSPSKRARLEKVILELGKENIKKDAGSKEIKVLTDTFSVNKAIYSKKGRTDREVNARIKAIPEFAEIIKQSAFSHTDTNIVGLDKDAKKNVVAMHYFETVYNGFDVEVVIRDKGEKQFLYEIKFKEKKYSLQSMPTEVGSSAPKGDVENDIRIPQNPNSVKGEFSLKKEIESLPAEDKEIVLAARQRAIYSTSIATMSESRLSKVYSDYSYSNPSTTNGYLAYIEPYDFISLTTTSTEEFLKRNPQRLNEGVSEWGNKNNIQSSGALYLRIDDEGNVIGHEGRHRMAGLFREGVSRVAVVIETSQVDNARPISIKKLSGQNFGNVKSYSSVYVHNMLPISKEYENINKHVFGNVTEGNKFIEPNIQYSLMDKEYLELAKNPEQNGARLREMVDEAAKNAGYTVKGLHSTNADFTVFDIDKTSEFNFHGKGIYFTNSMRDLENNYENYEGPDPWQKIEDRANEIAEEKYGLTYDDTLTGDIEIIDKVNECYDEAIEEFKKTQRRITAYLKFDNPLILEKGGKGSNHYNLQEYDGIIDNQVYENIGHAGTDENTVHYVVFNPRNIKSADTVTYDDNGNIIPLSKRFNEQNEDIRFSLMKPVEETKELVAVHNVWEDKLLKSLKLGGLPMPSIAIVRAREGHSNFGNISLVFRKETISPTDRRNKVYSADGWTPTYPRVEYKLNEVEQSKIEKKIDALVPRDVQKVLGGLYLDAYNMENTLNRSSDVASTYKNNYAMKYAFLRDSGFEVDLPMKNASLSSGGNRTNEAIIKVAETVPEEVLLNAIDGEDRYKSEPAIRNAVKEAVQEKYKDKPEVAKLLMQKYDEELSLGQLMGYAEDALRYKEEGIKQEIDYKEASNIIDEKIDTLKYEKWLKELFSNIIAKEGIRNDKDLFTPSGNRRSFEALHYEHTLENVVKAMKESGTIGIGGFGGNTILGASVVEYDSIEQIKEKASERMKSLSEEEYNKIREDFVGRFYELASSLPIHKDSFAATDDAANMLCEAVMKYKTKSGMANYLRSESKGWANYSDHVVDDLVELVNDIRNMPTTYFEAKPQRAVEFNEITTAIIPNNVSDELKTKLTENNIKFIEYEHGNADARLEALNSLEDVKFSLKRDTDLSAKDTKALLDIIGHLKGEFEVTKFAKADQKELAKMTKKLLKDYSSKADVDEIFGAIDELYQYLANGEDGHTAAWDDVYSRAYNIAEEIVKSAVVVDDEVYMTYKSLRDYLRNTPMKFDTRYDSVPSSYENFQDFRRRNYGRLNFRKDGIGIDGIYQELASLYPEFFNADEQITSDAMLERIIDVLDELKPSKINPYSREIKQTASYLANDIIDRFFDIPQAKPTFADKAERRVVEARIKGGKKVEAVRQKSEEKIKKLIEAQRSKTKKQIDKLREQRDTKVKKEQQKRRDAIAKMSESQKAKVLRAQIIRHASDLSKKLVNPTDNQHIPEDLRGVVAKLLESINLESNYTYNPESHSYKKNDDGLPTRRTQAFNELRDLYKTIASSVVVDPDLITEGGLLSDVISLADKRIADMNSTELQKVWDVVRAIEASVNTANKIFSQGKFETILEFAEALREDNEGKKERTEFKGVIGKGKTLTLLNMLTPETYFHYLGSAGDSIFRMMRDAQDKHIRIMKEVADFARKTLKGVNVNSLEKNVHTVKLGGEDVKLTTAQLMELYVLMKREQAVEHILIGGILPDVTKGKGGKLNTKAEPIRNISMAEITSALSNLTDEQKKVADELQKYVSTVLSEYGNEASMQVYNYEKFLEKNYWTIRTNKQEIASDVGKDTSVTTVANKGMAKGTKPHANTSVRIGSIFDTFASHSSDMATYAAWLGTSEDVNRIRNFVFWEDGTRKGTVKGILDTVHGIHGSEYLQKLLTDIAIGVKGADNMNPFDKFIGNYKAASVGANIRVIIQQPTAILRAMDMIGAHYLAAGAVKPLKGWEKALKYAPIAQWKDWGHFDINTGRQMKDVLFDNANWLEKVKQAGMWGASKMDALAWGQLWNAVEAETKAKHKELEVGSEEYYEAVAKRFTEIVDHTQVVDGILQRSGIMRSPDALTKMATSFMGEPTKQYNMAIAAAYDAAHGKGDARKKAVARLGRTALSLAVAGIVNACAQSIVDALRDDDKEKKYWEKWLDAFLGDEDDAWFQKLGNVGDTFNPLNYVPFAKDVASVLSGYDVKRMDVESISKVTNAVTNMYKAVTGTGKYTIAEASAALFAESARLFGLPVANVKRDVKSVVMTMANETDNYLLQYRIEKAMLDINYAGNSKNFMDILFKAYNNDKEAYEHIYKDLLKSGFDSDKIKNGMETRMKKAEGVEKASDLSKRYMTPESEKKYDSSLKRVQSSRAWKSATTSQRKEAEADLYNFLTSTSDDMKETRAEAKKAGVDETEYTLWKLAQEMANKDGKDGLSTKERASAIKMLDLPSDTEWDLYLFNNESKGASHARAQGVSADTYAEFLEALYAVDKPTKNGTLGTFVQAEATKAVNRLDGLTRKEKRALWQSVNTGWKKNPF